MKRPGSILKILILAVSFLAVVFVQIGYDATKIAPPPGPASSLSPEFLRLVDMGFHGTAGSFLWIATMPEVLGIYFRGDPRYLTDLKFVTAVDPKLSYPYAFSVLTLPALKRLPNVDALSAQIGQDGIAHADPDWRIPYYLAAHYYLDLKDTAAALKYYDLAAHTPGVPAFAARFALNFSALPDDRQKVEALWTSIRDTTNDENVKERADAYIARLQIFDYLEAAARAYRAKHGKFPDTLDALVTDGAIPALPQDPFGFAFKLYPSGTVGIDPDKLPDYLK